MSISLDDHERRIKDFEGKIVEIGDRIDNVIANAKDWAIVTLTFNNSYSCSIPSQYTDYKFAVIGYNNIYFPGTRFSKGPIRITISSNINTNDCVYTMNLHPSAPSSPESRERYCTVSRSGNNINIRIDSVGTMDGQVWEWKLTIIFFK